MKNSVFIATSLDGYIAGKSDELDWLSTFPEIDQVDTGYFGFTETIDALVMGRKTFEIVCGFDGDWPYKRPVFVMSKTMNGIPEKYQNHAFLVKGELSDILDKIHQQGYHNLYIDGGKTIQSFLKEDLIDEMIITTIPILLGGGIPLFEELPNPLVFECKKTTLFFDKVVQSHFVRLR